MAEGTLAAANQPPEQIEIVTETGARFVGATNEEVIEKMKSSIEEAGRTLKERKDEIETLRAAERERAAPPVSTPKNGFDVQSYYKGFTVEPGKANVELMAHELGYESADEFRRVFNPERVRAADTMLAQVQGNMAIAEFHRRIGERYPDSTDVAELMSGRMETDKRPLTADNLEITFNSLVREGKVKANPADAGGGRETAPPNTPTGGGGPKTLAMPSEPELLAMSDEEFAKQKAKYGLK